MSVTTAEAPSRDTLELRARAFVEQKAELSPQFRVTASAFVEGLVRRHPEVTVGGADAGSTVTTDAVLKAHDAFVEYTAGRLDLRVGLARVVWGRLDEVQPTDVVNPLDVSRFFFEGRSEARLPVALVRARVFLSDRASIEGVYVPVFRGGRFDQLDAASSSFTPLAGPADAIGGVCLAIGCPTLPPEIVDNEPAVTGRNAQGGARLNATIGRVDWSVSTFRGFESFPVFEPGPVTPAAPLRYRRTAPALHHDRRGLRDRPRRVGHPRRGRRLRPRQLSGVRAARRHRVLGGCRRRRRSARRQLPDQRHGALSPRDHRPADSGDPLRSRRG